MQAFYEDLNGRQYINEIFNFSVDKLFSLLFTESQFQRDFMEQRRFTGEKIQTGLLEVETSYQLFFIRLRLFLSISLRCPYT